MKLGSWLMMLVAMIMFLSFIGLPTGLTPILTKVGIYINPTTAQLTDINLQGASSNIPQKSTNQYQKDFVKGIFSIPDVNRIITAGKNVYNFVSGGQITLKDRKSVV